MYNGEHYVDSNNNRVQVWHSGLAVDGYPAFIVRLESDLSKGYIATQTEEDGGFGDETRPSSYGMSCEMWFGAGERFPTALDALNGIAD